MVPNVKMRSASAHQFAMVPRAEIPRAAFKITKTRKATFDAGYLIPVFCEEVLPGDTFKVRMTAFVRMATAVFPLMDNLHLESFFFFVPNRLVWANWVKFMGEQDNPSDSISFSIPQTVSPAGGFTVCSVYDYFGLPTVGQVAGGNTISINVLPLRAYYLIHDQWFRDENLQLSTKAGTGDGPDASSFYTLAKRGKRHDYFTSCLPWPQKGGTSVTLPLGTAATVRTNPTEILTGSGAGMTIRTTAGAVVSDQALGTSPGGNLATKAGAFTSTVAAYPTNLYADLSTATAATINQLRQAFQIQKLLERDARGGTRYTEIVRSHFGVISPDARLQRPEYLGGGSAPIVVSPIAQQTQTGVTGGATPLGTLAGIATSVAHNHGFSQSFTEHGYIIGMVNIRADLTYQQGLRKLWSRSTRYDFYFPAFAMLGEQAVLNKEIYCDGSVADANVFGYQERWAEYRYMPSEITGLFRSTSAGTIDPWHLSQRFSSVPTLNATFIQDASNTQVQRAVAAGASATNQQFLFDSFWDITAVRPMPLYSVPGLIDHF